MRAGDVTAGPAASAGRLGPFFWGARTDLSAFGGSALLALALVALARHLGVGDGSVPEWAWVAFVLGIDVAHVWATVFRTYFDGEELRRHRGRYVGLPVIAYLLGVSAYLAGPLFFWGCLAYLAVFHFVRQQVGWVALYRSRAGDRSVFARIIDDGAVYAAMGYPLIHWHAHLASKHFAWFIAGDFANLSRVAAALEPVARGVWAVALLGFFVRHGFEAVRGKRIQLGKITVVTSTALLWYAGIVARNSDFDFTVTNVITHGVPYFVLLWHYTKARSLEAPQSWGSRLVVGGPAVFVGLLVALAYVEELGWDRLVWHERGWLFGAGGLALGPVALTIVVPFLAMPQAMHYVLDGFLWRRKEAGPAQRAALGFAS